MTWVTVAQISMLMVVATVCVGLGHGVITDKRREDDYKRKENGL